MTKTTLLLVILVGMMALPLAAEDILTICGCPPNACPSGYTEIGSGTTPLATGCSGGCAPGVTPWWRQCTRCGDGYCRSGAETGASCGQDCCDANTSCNQIRATTTDQYCRRFRSLTSGTWNSGTWSSWTSWQWITPASYNLGWCSDPVNHLCKTEANCASTTSICGDVANSPHWKTLPISTCP